MDGKKGAASLQQIARRAKVSPATVSRVANSSGGVSQKVQERVLKVANRLGVDLTQRSKSKVITFLLSNRKLLHPFHARILLGAEEQCAMQGYGLLFLQFHYQLNLPWQKVQLPGLLERRELSRAVIVAGSNSQAFLELLSRKKIPYAILGNNVVGTLQKEAHDVVYFDDIGGAYETTHYLQSLGHRDIWYVANCKLPWFARRYEGYLRAMNEAGLPPRVSESYTDNEVELGYLAVKSILAGREPVSAIYAGGDQIAKGAYKVLKEWKLEIPRDISVAGHNDIEASTEIPPLTSDHVFCEEIGNHLAELALRRIAHPTAEPEVRILQTQLIKRESCLPLMQQREREPNNGLAQQTVELRT